MSLPPADQAKATVLIVDDDSAIIVALGKALQSLAHTVFATNGGDALERGFKSTPDLILLDMEMPGMSGLEVCKSFKANAETMDIPVIFITSHVEAEFEEKVFAVGAVDYIAKPLNPRVVFARVKTHLGYRQALAQLHELASHDGLTGLFNRRAFDERLTEEWMRARRHNGSLALLIVDIDEFKKYNDHFGHLQGDVCLRTVAELLKKSSQRSGDFVARYGGEEFVIVLPDTQEQDAIALAEILLQTIEQACLPQAPDTAHPVVTISIGCSVCEPGAPHANTTDASAIILAADAALYEAKRLGRNRMMTKSCD